MDSAEFAFTAEGALSSCAKTSNVLVLLSLAVSPNTSNSKLLTSPRTSLRAKH